MNNNILSDIPALRGEDTRPTEILSESQLGVSFLNQPTSFLPKGAKIEFLDKLIVKAQKRCATDPDDAPKFLFILMLVDGKRRWVGLGTFIRRRYDMEGNPFISPISRDIPENESIRGFYEAFKYKKLVVKERIMVEINTIDAARNIDTSKTIKVQFPVLDYDNTSKEKFEHSSIETSREKEEEGIIRQAHKLVLDCPNIAREEGFSESSVIDYDTAQAILRKEYSWRDIEHINYNRFNLFGVDKSVSGVPHKYFYDYYPSNKYSDSELTPEQRANRSFIWGFKRGDEYYQSRAIEMVSNFINQSRLTPYTNKLVLVCSPASNSMSNEARFHFFSDELCQKTGMTNGFDHIHITRATTPKHRGGNGCVEFEPDLSFFNGHYVLLFDDLVTSGGTISLTKHRLEKTGARIVGVISLGQTK